MEKAVLQALADARNYSLGANPPVERVPSKFQGNLKEDAKKNLRNLRKRDYCQCHPTRGGQTWQLTVKGLAFARENLI